MFLNFIANNWLSIVVVIGVLAYIIYLSITKQWTRVREFAYSIMLLAERTFSEQDGKIKFDFVVRIVYKYLPAWLKIFIREEDIKKFIQVWYETAKDLLDDGEINDSTKIS